MIRNDKSRFLLYIEPKVEEKHALIDDELSKLMQMAFDKATAGAATYSNIKNLEYFQAKDGWNGWHTTDCGEKSSNKDYLLENDMIVNSLCVFYVQYYRNSIHENDWDKLVELGKFYNVKIIKPQDIKDVNITDTIDDDIVNILVNQLSKNISEQVLKDLKLMKK